MILADKHYSGKNILIFIFSIFLCIFCCPILPVFWVEFIDEMPNLIREFETALTLDETRLRFLQLLEDTKTEFNESSDFMLLQESLEDGYAFHICKRFKAKLIYVSYLSDAEIRKRISFRLLQLDWHEHKYGDEYRKPVARLTINKLPLETDSSQNSIEMTLYYEEPNLYACSG